MISVIIPTQDRFQALSTCLKSLAQQDNPALLSEVIVVDDHSKIAYEEQIKTIAQQYSLPLIYESNPGRGPARARNYAASFASSEILGFLDDDAVAAPNWLSVIAREMNKPGVTAITGRILPYGKGNVFTKARQLRYELRQKNALAKNSPVTFFAGGNSAIWKQTFAEARGFDLILPLMHDSDLTLRLARQGKHCFYTHDLLIQHAHDRSVRRAIKRSFVSGHYRVEFEDRYPTMDRWSLSSQLHSFRKMAGEAKADPSKTFPALAACLLESIHAGGYLWHQIQRRRPGKVSPVALSDE
jgi:glycosyltransferase involved in cell wall biosynthesis